MKKTIPILFAIVGFASVGATRALSDDLEALAGKWSAPYTNEDGQSLTQQVEVKKDKFTYKISDADGGTRLYAEGDLKLEKTGPFKTISFTNIKAGESSSDTNPVDDTYTSIYTMTDDGAWLVVMNFDKERDNQKPRLDVYRKIKPAAKK